MSQIHITIKSFELSSIRNTIAFIDKTLFIIQNKPENALNNVDSLKKMSLINKKEVSLPPLALCVAKQRGAFPCSTIKNTFKVISLPKTRKLFTVLRSPHVDKKSREQFEFLYYKKKILIENKNNQSTVLFLFLLKNSEFPGVELELSLFYNSLFI